MVPVSWMQKKSWIGVLYTNSLLLLFYIWAIKKLVLRIISLLRTDPVDLYNLVLPGLGLLLVVALGILSFVLMGDVVQSWYLDRKLVDELRSWSSNAQE